MKETIHLLNERYNKERTWNNQTINLIIEIIYLNNIAIHYGENTGRWTLMNVIHMAQFINNYTILIILLG